MAIKYWEFEDAPLKEKMKSLNVKEIAKIFFDNETEAYRFGLLLLEVKKKGSLRLKDASGKMPVSTAKRYLDYAVQIGILNHENATYTLTDRFSRPLRNIATYIKAWTESQADEDIDIQFPSARRGKTEAGPENKDVADPKDTETVV